MSVPFYLVLTSIYPLLLYTCGPGKFAHWGVFGNKSFAVEEKAEFVLTLTYQEHDFYVQNNEVEIQLVGQSEKFEI
jgi:hypothetical protein